jgi:hypothetical protein
MDDQRQHEQPEVGAMLDRQATALPAIDRSVDPNRRHGDARWKFSYSHRGPVLIGRQALRSLPASIQSNSLVSLSRGIVHDPMRVMQVW